MQTFCHAHSEEIELVCNHPKCSSPLLCLLCFQDHSSSCSANYKTDIKRVRVLAQDQQWIQANEIKRNTIVAQIEELCQQRRDIHNENQRVVNEKFNQILNFLEIKYCVWSESLLGMTEHISNTETHEVFNKLTDHLEHIRTLNFDHENHLVRVQSARSLETSVLPEVSSLLERGRNAMEQWRLCQTKMENYKAQVIEFVQNMDLRACLGDEQQSVQPVQTLERNRGGNREAEALRAANQALQQDIQEVLRSKSELQNQVETLAAQNRALKAQNAFLLEAKSETTTETGSVDEEAGIRNKINIQELNSKIDNLNNQVLSLKSYINAANPGGNQQRPTVVHQQPAQESLYVNLQQQQEVLREVNRFTPNPSSNNNRDYSLVERRQNAQELTTEKKTVPQEVSYPVSVQKVSMTKNLAIDVDARTRIIHAEAHESLVAWIPRPAGSRQTDRLKLNLVYQATRDGFSANDFHSRCDDVGTTIAFIRTKETNRVFGGYTTKSWNAHGDCQWVEDREAFMFSLTHAEKFECAKAQYAIYAGKTNLISFGKGLDIGIRSNAHVNKSNAWTNFPTSYKCGKFCNRVESRESVGYLAGASNFLVEEIEVYQVNWN